MAGVVHLVPLAERVKVDFLAQQEDQAMMDYQEWPASLVCLGLMVHLASQVFLVKGANRDFLDLEAMVVCLVYLAWMAVLVELVKLEMRDCLADLEHLEMEHPETLDSPDYSDKMENLVNRASVEKWEIMACLAYLVKMDILAILAYLVCPVRRGSLGC